MTEKGEKNPFTLRGVCDTITKGSMLLLFEFYAEASYEQKII